MDAAGASILQQQMEEMGFSFYLDAKTREIAPEGGRLSVERAHQMHPFAGDSFASVAVYAAEVPSVVQV